MTALAITEFAMADDKPPLLASLHYWRSRSLGPNHTAEQAALAEWFGLQRASYARILAELYRANGEYLVGKVIGFRVKLCPQELFNAIFALRGAIGVHTIESRRNKGYRLTDAGLAECRKALEVIGG